MEYPDREHGGGDCDVPYRFERHATSYLHVREFARLLIVRGRLADRHLLRHRRGRDGFQTQPEAQ